MSFVVFNEPTALVLWIAVIILATLCFVVKRGSVILAVFCGAFAVAAVIVTLVFGAELLEIGTELTVLLLLCLTAKGVTSHDV